METGKVKNNFFGDALMPTGNNGRIYDAECIRSGNGRKICVLIGDGKTYVGSAADRIILHIGDDCTSAWDIVYALLVGGIGLDGDSAGFLVDFMRRHINVDEEKKYLI